MCNIMIPINKRLYEKVKRETKNRFNTWPSAYASSFLVKRYKALGGKYFGRRSKSRGVSRWHREKWLDACYWPKQRRPCARSRRMRMPYCRPSVRVSSKTPRLMQSLSAVQRKRLCRSKRRRPSRRMRSLRRKRSKR